MAASIEVLPFTIPEILQREQQIEHIEKHLIIAGNLSAHHFTIKSPRETYAQTNNLIRRLTKRPDLLPKLLLKDNENCSVWVSVNPKEKDSVNGVTAIADIPFDIDTPHNGQRITCATSEELGITYEQTLQLQTFLKNTYNAESIVGFTGNGFHIHVPVPIENIPLEERKRVNEVLRCFYDEVRVNSNVPIDSTGDISRRLTVIGTLNVKVPDDKRQTIWLGEFGNLSLSEAEKYVESLRVKNTELLKYIQQMCILEESPESKTSSSLNEPVISAENNPENSLDWDDVKDIRPCIVELQKNGALSDTWGHYARIAIANEYMGVKGYSPSQAAELFKKQEDYDFQFSLHQVESLCGKPLKCGTLRNWGICIYGDSPEKCLFHRKIQKKIVSEVKKTLEDDTETDSDEETESEPKITALTVLVKQFEETYPIQSIDQHDKPILKDNRDGQIIYGSDLEIERLLRQLYETGTGNIAPQGLISEAETALKVRRNLDEYDVITTYVTTAYGSDGSIWINFNLPNREGYHITKTGYESETLPEDIIFNDRGSPNKYPVPNPEGAKPIMEYFDEYLTYPDDGKIKLCTHLISRFIPISERAVMCVTGSEDSRKTTLLKIEMKLTQNKPFSKIGSLPVKDEDLRVLLSSRYYVSFDNISFTRISQSDILCKAVSHGTDIARTFYTNTGITEYAYDNCISSNGINDTLLKPDMKRRTFYYELPNIDLERSPKIAPKLFEEMLDKDLPQIYHSIFMTISKALEFLPAMKYNGNELVEQVQAQQALALALGFSLEDFDKELQEAEAEKVDSVIEKSPLAQDIIRIIDLSLTGQTFRNRITQIAPDTIKIYNGDLFSIANEIATENYPELSNITRFGNALGRLMKTLKTKGYTIDGKRDTGKYRTFQCTSTILSDLALNPPKLKSKLSIWG